MKLWKAIFENKLKYYGLPSSNEQFFIMPAIRILIGTEHIFENKTISFRNSSDEHMEWRTDVNLLRLSTIFNNQTQLVKLTYWEKLLDRRT